MDLPKRNEQPGRTCGTPAHGDPVRSAFADDPDMSELIQEFADEMPGKAAALLQLWQEGNRSELKRLAHQLKGAGGGYGFESLGACAARLEAMLNEQDARAERILEGVEELVAMCRRVRV